MKSKVLLTIISLVLFSLAVFAQDDEYRNTEWKKFTSQNWHAFDFSKKLIPQRQLEKMDPKSDDEFIEFPVSQLALLRGVVFGKRGRVFVERSIQDYLETQKWYKRNENFSNADLTDRERFNLDRIRLEEARRHPYIQPGDMRIWQKKLITDDDLGGYTPAELRVLIAEIEAIHGKTFPNEEWVQRYFEDRYWYKANPGYSSGVLNEFERKNIETLLREKDKGRNTAVAVGDMENFHDVLLTEKDLDGLTLMELRMIRNEFWARHGRQFTTPGIRQYFEWRDWYKPLKDQSKVKLSQVEQQNVNLILARETKIREGLSTEILADEAIQDLFTEDLRILRNEIFARRGRIFKDAELQKYFEAQSWYKANADFRDDMLTEIELKNLTKIREAEELAISKFMLFEG
ncbi:MAG: YARHG domain-containing protein [Pyrinomonadaceae bacterium]